MRSVMRGFVTDGTEHAKLRLERYEGDVENDLKQVIRFLTTEDPVSAYAIDYIDCEHQRTEDGWTVNFNAVYRRSPKEIQAILSVRGNEAALRRMRDAVAQLQNAVTIQISGYVEEDFAESLLRYCRSRPDLAVEMPRISAATYPSKGNVRVVELHIVYEDDNRTLRAMRSEVDSVLDSAYSYIRYAPTDRAKLELLYSYLTSRFRYQRDEQNAGAYTLLCAGVGSSESFASVVSWLCQRTGLENWLVAGEKDGEPYYWNVVSVDGSCRHLDFQTDAETGGRLRLLTDEQMTGYTWDTEAIPACVEEAPVPAEPQPEQ